MAVAQVQGTAHVHREIARQRGEERGGGHPRAQHPVLYLGQGLAGGEQHVVGGPGAALRSLTRGTEPAAAHRERFARPTARIREGRWAAEHGATAMIDLSDGLVSDADHLAVAGGVSLTIDLDKLPLLHGCERRDAARSGEEYELLFTAPGVDVADFTQSFGLPLTAIGVVAAATERSMTFTSGGKRVDLEKGYDHFSR